MTVTLGPSTVTDPEPPLTCLRRKEVGYVQVLDDPTFSGRIVLPQADAQVGTPIRGQRVKFIGYCSAIKNVATNPRDGKLGELSTIKFDSPRPLPLSDKERKPLELLRRVRVPLPVACDLLYVHGRP